MTITLCEKFNLLACFMRPEPLRLMVGPFKKVQVLKKCAAGPGNVAFGQMFLVKCLK